MRGRRKKKSKETSQWRTQAPEDHHSRQTEDNTSAALVSLKGDEARMKQRKHRHTGPYDPQTITRAVTHIRLEAANAGKLTALDDLAQVYLPLCQQYITLFCTEERPNKLRAPLFPTSLSERWQRVAIQQAAGIAQSGRTNRAQSYQDYADDLLSYHEQETEGTLEAGVQEPAWKEWNIPTLRQTCIQANANVVALEASQDSTFDYWVKISTLEVRKQFLLPLKLAAYHREART